MVKLWQSVVLPVYLHEGIGKNSPTADWHKGLIAICVLAKMWNDP
jgi:hypothetical protein